MAERRLTRIEMVDELWFTGSFLIPAAITLLAIVLTLPAQDFGTTVLVVQVVLLAMIAGIGFAGARRSGASIARSLAWAVVDVGVGLLIVVLKEVLSLIAH